MAFNQDAAFRIAAQVTGLSAVDQLRQSLDGVTGSVNGLTGKFGGLVTAFKGFAAAIGAVKLAEMVGGIIDAGDELNKLSQKTGVSVEALSTFKMAGKLADVQVEDLAKSFAKFEVAISKAETGSKEAAAAFRTIGISVDDLKSQQPEELILRTADAFSKMEDGPTKARIAVDLFGKSGVQMIPMLNMGRDAIEKLGVKMSTDFAQRAEQFNDTLVMIGAKTKMLTTSALMSLLPTLQEVTNAFMELVDTKPDAVGFMDGVSEAVRLVAVGINSTTWAVKELIDVVVTGGKSVKAAATGDFDAVSQLADEFVQRAQERTDKAARIQEQLLRNSLIFGDGTVEEIKARQRAETAPEQRPKGRDVDMSGLDTEKVDKFATALADLGAEAAKLQFQADHIKEFGERITTAKVATVAFETEQGKFKEFSAQQKAALMDVAKAVDDYSQKLRIAQAALQYDNATKKIEAEAAAVGQSNLVKARAVALQDLENAGIRRGTDEFEQLADARTRALTALQRAQEGETVDKWVRKMTDQTDAIAAEGDALRMTSLQYKLHTEAMKIDAAVAEASRDMTEDGAAAFRAAAEAVKQHRLEVLQLNHDQATTFGSGLHTALRSYAEELADVARSTHDAVSRAFQGMENALVDFVRTGKLDFRSLADAIISDMLRIALQQSIIRPLMMAMGFEFADGGIMTATGPMSLRTYAAGGIADRPQLAVFGEGSMPEAFVPLPDGRRIPVSLQGGGVPDNRAPQINQTINVDARGADAGVAAQVELAVKRGAQEGYSMVMRDLQRGGLAARLAGRA